MNLPRAIKTILSSAASLAPLFALAQPLPPPNDFRDVIIRIIELIQAAIGLGWAFLIAGFIYGVYKFLVNFDDERGREEGKRLMFWSIVATAVVLGIYGILFLLHNSLTNAGFGIPVLTPPAVF